MATLLSSSPTQQEEHHYYQWASEYLWNDRKCDHCGRLLPEEGLQIHDVYDRETGRKIPKTVYCSPDCYALEQQPELLHNGTLIDQNRA